MKKLRLAGTGSYEQAQRYLEERYVAEHNRALHAPGSVGDQLSPA